MNHALTDNLEEATDMVAQSTAPVSIEKKLMSQLVLKKFSVIAMVAFFGKEDLPTIKQPL